MAQIPWAKPYFRGDEQRYVGEALASTWISGGAFIDRLERDIARYCEVDHALAVSSGTAALHLAYLGAGLKAGDEVIVPGFGFLAAANVALHMGARPVFAEVEPRTWCVTAPDIERCLTGKTRLIVPVHTYGNVCRMDEILDLSRRHGVAVIEDAAESFGSRYKGQLSGTFGLIGCFSFQATKTITTGEGGLVVTDETPVAETMALYRSHGMLRKRHYWHELPGHNFRLTNLQAALGCAQYDNLEAIIKERRRVSQHYRARLGAERGVKLQQFDLDVDPVVWALALRLDPEAFPQGRDAVMRQMDELGIETRPGFYAPSMMDFYGCPPLSVCEALSRQIISLPCFPALSAKEIDRIRDGLMALRA
jgi:perosamine synthetase